MKFVHINIVVRDPDKSADFYKTYLMPEAAAVWLGDSLHLRDSSSDLAFQTGDPKSASGAHHGFVAESAKQVDELVQRLQTNEVKVTDDCTEEGFRSVKFLDRDGYEVEVYWEDAWPH